MLDKWARSELFNDELSLTSFLSFVDDGLLISSASSFEQAHTVLKKAYGFVHGLLQDFGLVLEHSKTEIFNFSRRLNDENPPIDLGFAPFTGLTPLSPKVTWRYLGIFFDRSLTFRDHVRFYATKSLSAAKCMRILGNSTRGLEPRLKRLLFISCIHPIATYGHRCWYNPTTRGYKGNLRLLEMTFR